MTEIAVRRATGMALFLNFVVVVAGLIIAITPFPYSSEIRFDYIAMILVLILLVNRLNAHLMRIGSQVVEVDYTIIFTIFSTLLMGPLAGVSIVIIELLLFSIKHHSQRARLQRTPLESWLIYSYNIINSGFCILTVHAALHLTGGALWMLAWVVPVLVVVGEVMIYCLFIHLSNYVAALRNRVADEEKKRHRLFPILSDCAIYFIYIGFGPILLYMTFTTAGLPGFLLALAILIPSQATGMLYMQLKTKQKELFTDELTGISNSTRFRADMETQLRLPEPYVLILCDLDNFKKINDACGHLAGNDALIEFSAMLTTLMARHSSDCRAYRLHGDEFMMRVTNIDKARTILDELNGLIGSLRVTCIDQEMPLEFSAGAVAIAPGTHSRDAFHLVDAALYTAKKTGRGKVWLEDESGLIP